MSSGGQQNSKRKQQEFPEFQQTTKESTIIARIV